MREEKCPQQQCKHTADSHELQFGWDNGRLYFKIVCGWMGCVCFHRWYKD